jgi:hypothetical protein
MAKPFDATLNSLLDAHAEDWARFLAERTNVPFGPVASLDTDLSATLQADRLFRLGGEPPSVLHLELESSGRLGIPEELLHYNLAARRATRLPVKSVVILLRPKATATDLTGTLVLPDVNGEPDLTFRYSVVLLWQESVETLLATGPGLAPLALLTNEADANLPAAFERFHRRLRTPDVPDRVRENLLGSAFVLGGLRYSDDRLLETYMSLNNILEDSTTYQWLLRKGRTKGTQGVLLRQGARRFGPPPDATEATLVAITDEERLGRISDRIFDATGWDDLLATE